MSAILFPAVSTAVTAAVGDVVTVTSSTGFKVGAFVWLNDTSSPPQNYFCKIMNIPDGTHITLRRLPDPGMVLEDKSGGGGNNVPYPNYGGNSMAAFNAGGGTLSQDVQYIYVINADQTLNTQA